MIDVSPDYLLSKLDVDTAKEVWRHMRGMRIYFPICKSKHDEIRTLYNSMSTERSERIKRIAQLYEMSEDQIRRITKTQGELFGED